jgi:RP/EB family microtubule-associated protein
MSRVKFNATTEYQYLENFKILSNTFRKHAVDRPLPTESLVKCKMQDNLEFLQWTKRYWDQYYPGGDYDAVGRRKGAAAAAPPSMGSARSSTATSGARRPVANATAPRTASRQTGGGGAASAALQAKNTELMETVQGLERERDFYFSKLRDIELLIQQAMEANPVLEEEEDSLLKQIQTILYSTEVSEADKLDRQGSTSS